MKLRTEDTESFTRSLWLGREASKESRKRYTGDSSVDGNQDAYRHMYWSALLTRELGEDYALKRLDAHEDGGTNLDSQMDNLNNQLGIKIALENPDISKEFLKDLIQLNIDTGDAWILNEEKTKLIPSTGDYRKEKYEPAFSIVHRRSGRIYSGLGLGF